MICHRCDKECNGNHYNYTTYDDSKARLQKITLTFCANCYEDVIRLSDRDESYNSIKETVNRQLKKGKV